MGRLANVGDRKGPRTERLVFAEEAGTNTSLGSVYASRYCSRDVSQLHRRPLWDGPIAHTGSRSPHRPQPKGPIARRRGAVVGRVCDVFG